MSENSSKVNDLIQLSNTEDLKVVKHSQNPSIFLSTLTATPSATPNPTLTFTPSPSPTVTLTPTKTADPWVMRKIEEMDLNQKIGQMMMIGVYGTVPNGDNCSLIQNLSPGGVVYVSGNVSNPDQLKELSQSLQSCSRNAQNIPLITSLDHEGQYVTRFNSGATIFPCALAQGASADLVLVQKAAATSGQELAYSGVNMVLGPVADVLLNYDNFVISQRSFGSNPQVVAYNVSSAVVGYKQANVIPVLKHFPGHGGVAVDSHQALPIDNADGEILTELYLPPFIQGIRSGASVVMLDHVSYPKIDGESQPASLSREIINLLREDLGFGGVVLTDSMGMNAITGQGLTVPQASVLAVEAGVDMLLLSSPSHAYTVRDALLKAVDQGQISIDRIDGSVKRILILKSENGLNSYPLVEVDEPDWAANRDLAFEIGYRAPIVYRDEAQLIPIPAEMKRIQIVGPEDGWGLYPVLVSRLEAYGFSPVVQTYTGPWKGNIPEWDFLNTLPASSENYDLTIVLTWEAHLNKIRYGDNWQPELVRRLQETGQLLVVVALKSPTDILEFQNIASYMATFGTKQGQIQALADILVGIKEPTGTDPLLQLP